MSSTMEQTIIYRGCADIKKTKLIYFSALKDAREHTHTQTHTPICMSFDKFCKLIAWYYSTFEYKVLHLHN